MPGELSRWRAGAAPDWRSLMLLAVAVAFCAAVYMPITRNYFFADDFLNLFNIANGDPVTYLLTPHGGHLLLSRNAFFLVSDWTFGTNPAPYFWTVLATHLLNVALLYYVIRTFTDSARLACAGAVLWGSAPVHAGTLGWYSVYGQVVTATALLAIIAIATHAAAHDQSLGRGRRTLCYILALIGATSFGVGIGVALVLPLMLVLLLPRWRRDGRWPPCWSLIIVVPAFYFLANWLYVERSGNPLPTAEMLDLMRRFDPALRSPGNEPPLQEMLHVYLLHWYAIPKLLVQLLVAGVTHLIGAPLRIAPPAGLLSYGIAALFAATCAVGLFRASSRTWRHAAVCVVLAVGCYGMIALGRASLYQTLEGNPTRRVATIEASSREPRYHYVGLLPFALLSCVVLDSLGRRLPLTAASRNALLVVWLALTGAGVLYAGSAIDHHDRARQQTHDTRTAIQALIDAQPVGTDVLIANRFFGPIVFPVPAPRFPGWAAAFVIFFPANTIDGKRVFFLDSRTWVIDALKNGRRTADLFRLNEPAGRPLHRRQPPTSS